MSDGQQEKIWENPDPRIKWALDLLGDDGYERTPVGSYIWYPSIFAATIGAGHPLKNWTLRRPMWSGLHITLPLIAAGWCLGVLFRERQAKKNADEEAVLRHYIMLHPEKFPEPELKKFGDRQVFLNWNPNR